MDAPNAQEISPTTAVVGLGRMGRAMALRLLARGLPLIVANRSTPVARAFASQHGGRAVALPEVLTHAEICLTSVSDSAALEELVGGAEGLLAGGFPGGRVLVDASTVSVDSSSRVAALLRLREVGYLRAPVAGNPAVIEAGNLTFMVSGDPELLERVRPVLEAIGPTILHVGDAEQARAMKLALNVLLAGTTELVVEAVALAEANGLSRQQALGVMTASVAASPFLKYKASALAAHDFTATATTELIAKDLRLARALAEDSNLSLPATDLVADLLDETIRLGHGDKDFLALALRLSDASSAAARRTGRSR